MLLDLIYGLLNRCRHRHLTWPQSARGGTTAHVSCLDCGKSFSYDFSAMKRGPELRRDALTPTGMKEARAE